MSTSRERFEAAKRANAFLAIGGFEEEEEEEEAAAAKKKKTASLIMAAETQSRRKKKIAFCDRVFRHKSSSAFLTDVSVVTPPSPRAVTPLRFVERDKRPPKGLTYAHVPRGLDSLFKYCGGCVFADLPRCQYCQAGKVSREHRLALPRLAALLLCAQPRVSARDLANKLAKYARSDEFAAEMNKLVGWEPRPQALCDAHRKDLLTAEEEALERKTAFDALASELADAKRCAHEATSKFGTLARDAEALRKRNAALESKQAELTARLKRCEIDVELARDEVSAQSAIARCLQREIETHRSKEWLEKETQAAFHSEWHRETQTDQILGVVAFTQTDKFFVRRNSSARRPSALLAQQPQNNAAAGETAKTPTTTTTTTTLPPKQTTTRRASLSLFSKIGATKKFPSSSTEKLVPLPTLLDMIHEVVDKKVQNNRGDSLVDFVRIFWREKLGLRKLANKKTAEMIRAVKAYAKQHSRVAWFAVNLGVRTAKIDDGATIKDAPWVPWIPDSTFDLLARIFFDSSVVFSANYQTSVVDKSKVLCAVVGSSGVLDHAVKLNDSTTWNLEKSPLCDMMSPHALRRFVDDVAALPEIQAVPEKNSTAPQKVGISIDKFLDLLLGYQVKATVEHQRALTAAFHRFDGGEPGLDIDEFKKLVEWTLTTTTTSSSGIIDDDVEALYAKIENLADAGLIDGENDKNINDSLTFPIVIMQQVPNCPLAFARTCRRWWTLDDGPSAAGTAA